MKTVLPMLLLILVFLCTISACAEGADPFRPVPTQADVAGPEAVTLTFTDMDFADGATLLRLKAKTDSELRIRVYADSLDSAPVATVTFRPVNKEFRPKVDLHGIHTLYWVLEGSGRLDTWQAFASQEDLERAVRAEKGTVYDDSIPSRYLQPCEQGGTVEAFVYTAHDYSGDLSEYEKQALVYLPYGYDPAQTYDLLILCHGIGGSEYEWGLSYHDSRVRQIMDNLIARGEIRPFLVVTPNGRAGLTSDYSAFYSFDRELREDLLPALGARYAVDITDRSRCAMAGLSMGGMQTINLGIGKCLDLFSAFGAFSAAPTSNTAPVTASILNAAQDLPVRVFYSVCGTEDNVALSSSDAAVNGLMQKTDRLNAQNCFVQHVRGGHDFTVWYLGFYNFARMIGAQR